MSEDKFVERINQCIEQGVLVSPDMNKEEFNDDLLSAVLTRSDKFDMIYLNKDITKLGLSNLIDIDSEINWRELEKTKVLFEKKGTNLPYDEFIKFISKPVVKQDGRVKVIKSFEEMSSKKEVRDFSLYFNSRFEALKKILFSRTELKNTTSISRIINKKERESASIIGMLKDKRVTKNGNIMLTLEDNTEEIKVLVNKNKAEIFDIANDCVMDEVIGISGVNGDKIVFANNLILPEIPRTKELKKCSEEAYAIFLSDIHIGSNNFLEEDFNRFLSWINQETGSASQKEVASKVKYVFIVGDLVDGVGIYPNQDDELVITDVFDQYKKCKELLSKIPKHIELIMCAGNHDALRIAEPQPPFCSEFSNVLHELPNATIVSNPGIVNIHSSDDFEGYNVLLYHGYSFDYYIANVDSIRNGGGYDRADLIMKFLLKRRHLAPTHTSTLYVPYTDMDPLVIDTIPDFFITGHIHKTAVSNYKNITLISGSCWQSKTSFQAKMGHHPEPSRVPIVNLATREVKVLRFGK